MADNNAERILGGIAIACLVIAAVMTAIAVVIVCGSFLGTGVGLVNYYKALEANVRFERPGVV